MATLHEFLTDLSTDPQKLKAFKADPHGTIQSAGLSHEDQQALRSGDPQAIKARIGTPSAGGPTIIVVVVLLI